MIVNNTFVEWAAAQALRRAQPRVLGAGGLTQENEGQGGIAPLVS